MPRQSPRLVSTALPPPQGREDSSRRASGKCTTHDPQHVEERPYLIELHHDVSNWPGMPDQERLDSKMTGSPSKQIPLPAQHHQLASPRSAGRLRQMKSAHNLSTNYTAHAGPSLISQQRQQQQQQGQQQMQQQGRHHESVPPVPAVLSPQKHGRSRSNSDAVLPPPTSVTPSPRKGQLLKKTASPREELESLVRYGPNGNTAIALQNLRHWILCEGMDADSDGMARTRPSHDPREDQNTDLLVSVPLTDLRLVDIAQRTTFAHGYLSRTHETRSLLCPCQDMQ